MILAIVDQHHMGGLEKVVESNAHEVDSIIAMGDMSATQRIASHKSSKLKKYQLAFKRKNNPDLSTRELYKLELTAEDKKIAHRTGILNANKKEFEDLLIWYGGGPIFNLGRKIFTGSTMFNNRKEIIVYKGSEPLIADAQQVLYERVMEKKGIKEKQVMDYIIDFIDKKQSDIIKIVGEQIDQAQKIYNQIIDSSDYQESFKDQIKPLLGFNNFDQIPDSELIYQTDLGMPWDEGFRYLEDLDWEVRDNTFMIHVPYFESYKESSQKIQRRQGEIIKEIKRRDLDYCLIMSHANPSPEEGMKGNKRRDHNTTPLTDFFKEVVSQKKYKKGNITMLTGHLHQRWNPYIWKEAAPILIAPMGVKDIALIDTKTNKIEISTYTR